jgi:hypothetical protein
MLCHSEPLQSLFGRVIGDPIHRLECIWVKDGARCWNAVSKSSRINGALCLRMFQEFPVSHSHELRLSMAASYMLCAECSRHSSRSRVCAQRWMKLLHARANRVEQTTQILQEGRSSVLSENCWPNSMSFDAGTTEFILSASPSYHPVYSKAPSATKSDNDALVKNTQNAVLES